MTQGRAVGTGDLVHLLSVVIEQLVQYCTGTVNHL